MNRRLSVSLLRQTAFGWLDHEGPRLAASLSFYTLLSLAPLVILTIAISSIAFGRPAAQQAIVTEVATLIGPAGVHTVQDVLNQPPIRAANGLASAIGVFILLFGASSVFGELQSALNKIWEVGSSTRAGLWPLVCSRLLSFAMVLALGFLSLVSLLISTAVTALGTYFDALLPGGASVLGATNALLSFAVITALIAVILKYVPDVSIPWRDVWAGAAATAVLFTLGKYLIGLYLGKAAVASAYGAAGSLVAVIVWVYYSAMIFYFGAEFTHRAHLATSHKQARPKETGNRPKVL